MIPEQLTQPPVHLRGPASPENDFLYVATKVATEEDVSLVEFGEEVSRDIWPKRVTEVDWFEVIGCANQRPWGGGGEERGLELKYIERVKGREEDMGELTRTAESTCIREYVSL